MTDNLPRKIRAEFDPAFDGPQERDDGDEIALTQSDGNAVLFDPDNDEAFIKSNATADLEVMR